MCLIRQDRLDRAGREMRSLFHAWLGHNCDTKAYRDISSIELCVFKLVLVTMFSSHVHIGSVLRAPPQTAETSRDNYRMIIVRDNSN